MHATLIIALAAAAGQAAAIADPRGRAERPNIVWFLTDDQDQMLGASFPEHGGVGPMAKTKRLMAQAGATAVNFFIHTPICCPSRSELLTGMYFHNIKAAPGTAPACMHTDSNKVNNNTFAKYLHSAGYTVGMFGKYLNAVPATVPEGYDAWLANGGGDYFGPEFSTRNAGVGIPDGQHRFPLENYTTSVVGNLSIAWIRTVRAAESPKPFFAYVAPKAAHEPFNPAPWYRDAWEPDWPEHEPRPVSWNCSMESRAHHHGNIATEDMMSSQEAAVVTGVFKNRWRTLMSVDDVIAGVIEACEQLGVADNTYFFYSSDHGFQLGEFNIPMDKRQPYDFDTRIHLLARGPGIKAGSTWSQPATQVDMAPTFLGLAGLEKPPSMDGKSLAPILLQQHDALVPESTRRHLNTLGERAAYVASWRTQVFIEYYYNADNDKCMQNCTYPSAAWPSAGDVSCTDLKDNRACWGGNMCDTNCYPTETVANNFIVLRSMAGSEASGGFGNTLYAEFQTGRQNQRNIDFDNLSFVELFDLERDPWMMSNVVNASGSRQAEMHDQLHKWYRCQGDTCP